MIIYLSDQPDSMEGASFAILFGLAPSGVFQHDSVTRITGSLLHCLFTLTCI